MAKVGNYTLIQRGRDLLLMAWVGATHPETSRL